MNQRPENKPVKRIERVQEGGRNEPRDQSTRPTPPPKPPAKKPKN